MSKPCDFFGGSVPALVSRKNLIINGNFRLWERGTVQSAGVSGYGSDDRWLNNQSAGYTRTNEIAAFPLGQTEVAGNPTYYCRVGITVAGAGVGDYVYKQQAIENVRVLSGTTVTVSFWAKADSPKDISLEARQNFGSGGSATVTGIGVTKLSLTTAWQKFTVTIDIPSISGKTAGSGSYTAFRLWFGAGSDSDAFTDGLGNQAGTFNIAQVQVEKGATATPFELRTYAEELALCQRYFFKMTDDWHYFKSIADTSTIRSLSIMFPVPMRTIPTMTKTYITSGATGLNANDGAYTDIYKYDARVNVATSATAALLRSGEFDAEL